MPSKHLVRMQIPYPAPFEESMNNKSVNVKKSRDLHVFGLYPYAGRAKANKEIAQSLTSLVGTLEKWKHLGSTDTDSIDHVLQRLNQLLMKL